MGEKGFFDNVYARKIRSDILRRGASCLVSGSAVRKVHEDQQHQATPALKIRESLSWELQLETGLQDLLLSVVLTIVMIHLIEKLHCLLFCYLNEVI
jgi:hypothetical protein